MTAENLRKSKEGKVGYCHSEAGAMRKGAREQSRYHTMNGVKECEGDEVIVSFLLVSSGVEPAVLPLEICYCPEILEPKTRREDEITSS